MLTVVPIERLANAKRAFSTRTVPDSALRAVRAGAIKPRAGDLVLARVVQPGQHKQLELPTSRKATLFPGDDVILAYGNRYAPDQFEAYVPDDLGPCEMVAAGGIAGRVESRHASISPATRIEPVGLFVKDGGDPVNVRDHALKPGRCPSGISAIAVVGGSMNTGKTTTAASLVHGFTRAGYRVGAAKLTGTGAGTDYWHMKDAGAVAVHDFTDAGFATTYKTPHTDIERCAETLAAALAEKGAEIMIFEIADGFIQEETAALVASKTLRRIVGAYVYAGDSAASAAIGVDWLRRMGNRVLCVSGIVSTSPLAARETERATGLLCLTREALTTADRAQALLAAMDGDAKEAAA